MIPKREPIDGPGVTWPYPSRQVEKEKPPWTSRLAFTG